MATNEELFDTCAAFLMDSYDPVGFKKKYQTLFKVILIAMDSKVDQETASLQLKIKQLQEEIQLLRLELSGITGGDSV